MVKVPNLPASRWDTCLLRGLLSAATSRVDTRGECWGAAGEGAGGAWEQHLRVPASACLFRLTFMSACDSFVVICFLLRRSFDGFSSAQKNQEQLLTLASMLREEGKVFSEKVYYTAGYNSPFKLLDRNNEVWLIQKNEPCKETE